MVGVGGGGVDPAAIAMVGAVTVTLPASNSTMLPCALTAPLALIKTLPPVEPISAPMLDTVVAPFLSVTRLAPMAKPKPVVHGGQDAEAVDGGGGLLDVRILRGQRD